MNVSAIRRIAAAVSAATLLLLSAQANATFTPVRVNVETEFHYASGGFGNGLATGLFFDIGDRLNIDASNETWGLCGLSGCVVDADGNAIVSGGPTGGLSIPPTYTHFGQTFKPGVLVGTIGNSPFFMIGSSYDQVLASGGGELKLFQWDLRPIGGGPSGGIQVEIDPTDASTAPEVPVPATAALLLTGMAGLAGLRRWRAHR
jgi:hypothetical protein